MRLTSQDRHCDDRDAALTGSDFSLRNLRGSRVLIVEDDFLLAHDLSRTLTQIGMEVLGPVPTLHQAMPHLTHADAAVLDINLDGVPVFPLADLLDRNRTPFVFFSGCSSIVIPERFRYVCTLPKPADARDIISSLESTPSRPAHSSDTREEEGVMSTIPSLRLAARLMMSDEAAADRLVERTLLRAIETVANKEDGVEMLGWLLSLLEDVRRQDGQSCMN